MKIVYSFFNKFTFANNLETMQPRLRILHCFEYGKYGMTPTMERAEDVLHAYAMINNSIMLLLTSLYKWNDKRKTIWINKNGKVKKKNDSW